MCTKWLSVFFLWCGFLFTKKSLLLEVAESPDLEVPCPAPHPGHRGGPLLERSLQLSRFFFSQQQPKQRVFFGDPNKNPFPSGKNQGKLRWLFVWVFQREEVIVCNIPSLLWLRWHSEEWCNLPRPNPLEIVFFSSWLVFWSSFMSETAVFLGLFAWSINAFRTWKTLTGESAHTGPRDLRGKLD